MSDELLARLCAMRAETVETMARAVTIEEDWHAWLPLLGQLELAIRAVRIVQSEQEAAP